MKKLRCQKALTQEQLAARCQLAGWNVSRSSLAQIEGRVRFVTDQELQVLARVLEVSIDGLFPARGRKPRA